MAFLGASGEKNQQKLETFNPLPAPGGGSLNKSKNCDLSLPHSFNHVMFDCCLECLIFFNRVISVKAAVLSDILNITAGRNIFFTEILVLNVKPC